MPIYTVTVTFEAPSDVEANKVLEHTYYGYEDSDIEMISGDIKEEVDDVDPGDMDGDAASALASAGFGTDEDYGYYGGDE